MRSLVLALSLVALAGAASASTWTHHSATGPSPSERSTPAVATVNGSIYLFGGVFDDFSTQLNTFYSDLYRFDPATDTWHAVAPVTGSPPARAFAAAVGHRGRGLLLVFGGSTYGPLFAGFTAFDDLWAYSPANNAWFEIHPASDGPSGRSRPTAWLVGDGLYVFGGVDSTFTMKNDLWVYDLATNRWTELIPDGAAGSPPPRHEAQAGTRAARGRLTLYGGEGLDLTAGFTTFADTWELDLATLTWSDVTPANPVDDVQPERNYGAAEVIGGHLYLQGGDLPGGSSGCGAPFPQNPTEEMWRFHGNRRVWEKLAPGGDPLVRLKRTASAVAGGRMYVFSGWDFQCTGTPGSGPGQIWNREVYSFEP